MLRDSEVIGPGFPSKPGFPSLLLLSMKETFRASQVELCYIGIVLQLLVIVHMVAA